MFRFVVLFLFISELIVANSNVVDSLKMRLKAELDDVQMAEIILKLGNILL
jgi:hypothetical protein